jgi:hypothetical protein
MPTRIDSVIYQVIVSGVDITDKVQKVTVTLDFNQRISTCEIELTEILRNVRSAG